MLAVNELTGHNVQSGGNPVTSESINAGLWEYWPLDVVSGNRRGVVNGRNLDASFGTVLPLAGRGKLGHAAIFDAATKRLSTSATGNGASSYTVAGWVKVIGGDSGGLELFKVGSGTEARVSFSKPGGMGWWLLYGNDGVSNSTQIDDSGIDFGSSGSEFYRFVALVVDNGVGKLWLDGGINAGVGADFLLTDSVITWPDWNDEVHICKEAGPSRTAHFSCVGAWDRALTPAELLYLWKDGDGRKLHYENIFPIDGAFIIGGINAIDGERITDGDAVGYPGASTNMDPSKECRLYAPEAWVGWQFPFPIATPQYFKAWRGTQQTNVGSAAVFLEGSLDTANWQTWYQYGHQGPYDTAELAPTSLHPDYPTKYPFWRYRWFGPNEPAGSFLSLEELELFV